MLKDTGDSKKTNSSNKASEEETEPDFTRVHMRLLLPIPPQEASKCIS